MKRRDFLTNSSLVLAGLSAPLGLSAMLPSASALSANHSDMLAEFRLTLTDYPGSTGLKARLATVASIEYSDTSTLRFRSLTGERCELRRVGDHVVTRLLA